MTAGRQERPPVPQQIDASRGTRLGVWRFAHVPELKGFSDG
jgi:hypothetical protein